MGDANLDELIAQAKDRVGAIIAKPKMTEKLLAKPPFRFLHDTVTAITAATGFGAGLFNEQELDSAAITDKNAKMAYLDKIFNLVGICKGAPLDVKSLKVVQGLEPEYTNKFLIALAECASDSSLDFEDAVRRCLGGEQPGQNSPPSKRGAVAEAKDSDRGGSGRQSKPQDDNKFQDERKPGRDDDRKEIEAKIPVDLDRGGVAPERGKSRGGTRGGKPNQATTDTGLSGLSAMAPKLDGEIEKCDGSEAMTQQLLGELITRPKLTEKLLSKPPFRFLHDVVMEVIRATGFGRGLYTDFETDSQNVADKNQKMAFLEKIIKLVGVQLNTLVEARPNRIVAGLDPQITNNFLQLLAIAAKHMPDSTNAVKVVLEQFNEGGSGGNIASDHSPPPNARPIAESKNEDVRPQPVQQSISNFPEAKEERNQTFNNNPPPQKFDDRRDAMPDEKLQSVDINMGDDSESKRSARPTTARRRPPKVKDGATELQSKDIAPAPKKTAGIIIDGARDDDDDDIPDETRLVDEMKADSKNDDGVGPNQSKLVQDIKARQLEQEAAIRAQKNEAAEETKIVNESNGNAGGSGIRLGKLRKTGLEKKAAGTSSVSTFAEGDLDKIRASVQALVQQTGPLGTCMDFIQEDISLMTSELHKWEEECRKYEVEYEEAKRKTKEVLHPLKVELADLEDQILEQISKISSAKATNARNDEKIQNLLKMMSNT